MPTANPARKTGRSLRLVGRLITVLWAVFWIWFGLASGMGEAQGATATFLHILFPGLIFLVLAVLSFTWYTGSAILLVAVGLAIGILYPLMATNMPLVTVLFIEMAMAIPPLVAGILLLLGRRRKERPELPPPAPPPEESIDL